MSAAKKNLAKLDRILPKLIWEQIAKSVDRSKLLKDFKQLGLVKSSLVLEKFEKLHIYLDGTQSQITHDSYVLRPTKDATPSEQILEILQKLSIGDESTTRAHHAKYTQSLKSLYSGEGTDVEVLARLIDVALDRRFGPLQAINIHWGSLIAGSTSIWFDCMYPKTDPGHLFYRIDTNRYLYCSHGPVEDRYLM